MRVQIEMSNMFRRTPWWDLVWTRLMAAFSYWPEGHEGPYRPERHYMRGPGPKWRAKHGRSH